MLGNIKRQSLYTDDDYCQCLSKSLKKDCVLLGIYKTKELLLLIFDWSILITSSRTLAYKISERDSSPIVPLTNIKTPWQISIPCPLSHILSACFSRGRRSKKKKRKKNQGIVLGQTERVIHQAACTVHIL